MCLPTTLHSGADGALMLENMRFLQAPQHFTLSEQKLISIDIFPNMERQSLLPLLMKILLFLKTTKMSIIFKMPLEFKKKNTRYISSGSHPTAYGSLQVIGSFWS